LVLGRVAYPGSYAILYGMATLSLFMGWVSFLFIKEPRLDLPPVAKTRPPLFAEAWSLVKSDRSFMLYIVSRALLTLSFAGTSFFPVFLVEAHNLPVSVSGTFALITAATFVVVNPLLGAVADRVGYKPVFVVSFASLVTGAILGLLGVPRPISFGLIALAAISQSVNLFAFNMTLEFAPKGQIPTYIGVSGLFVGIAAPLAVVIGYLVDRLGYDVMFWITGVTAGLGMLVMLFGVEEPRVARRRLNQPDTPI
jgi:predicted MFS family arabinose efflux permease